MSSAAKTLAFLLGGERGKHMQILEKDDGGGGGGGEGRSFL